MSVIFSSTNNGLVSTATANPQKTNSDKIYFTVPWVPTSRINRIEIFTIDGTLSAAFNVYILRNGARYRFSPTLNVGEILGVATTPTPIANTAVAIFDPPIFVEESYNQPFIQIMIDPGSFAGKTFSCRVYGEKAVPSTYLRSDSSGFANEVYNAPQVLSATGGTVWNITAPMQKRGGEYVSKATLASSNDYIYVGSERPITKWALEIGTGGTSGTGFTIDFYNGSAWSAIGMSILDNTTDGHTDTGGLHYSGTIEAYGTFTNSWAPSIPDGTNNMPLDTRYIQRNIINAGVGTVYPSFLGDLSPRYWLRFRHSTWLSTVTFNTIRPIG